MNASNFRYVAREALRGKWPISILITFVATLLGAGSYGNINFQFDDTDDIIEDLMESGGHAGYGLVHFGDGFGDVSFLGDIFLLALSAVALILVVIGLVLFIIGAAVELGLKLYNLQLVAKVEPNSFSTLFERFPIFARALGLRLLMSLFIFLWSLLLVIPGIIAAYRYAMAPYLMAQHPEMGVFEALERSKALMTGNKWRLFCLHISFIGWAILAAIPAGLGFLVLNPYVNAAESAFYLELTGQLSTDTAY